MSLYRHSLAALARPRIGGSSSLVRRAVSAPSSSAPSSSDLTLYQYKICPFCNKTKAFLDYAGLSYSSVEVNPLTKAELKWSEDYRKVPVATVGESVLKGSDGIVEGLLGQDWVIGVLEEKWARTTNTTTNGSAPMDLPAFSSKESEEWVSYANDELAVLLYPNLCPSIPAAYGAFGYVNEVPSFTPMQRVSIRAAGAVAMYLAASRVKKKHGIDDERAALTEALRKPLAVLAESSSSGFLSGKSDPHLGDLAVFGCFKGLVDTTSVPAELFQAEPALEAWYHRVAESLEQ